MANRLAGEKSPYLLQHKDNPVDWQPWGPDVLDRARAEDKPVFLSIGYSTCHWCHVMAHESFEDPEVARLMNEAFINVKVDREERPDLDAVYMSACHLLTGSGGWPLNVVLAPDGRPFFAGTYFPKATRFGRIGMLELIPKLGEYWRENREQAVEVAAEIVRHLKEMEAAAPGSEPDEATLAAAARDLAGRFDEVYGGFGDAPKFPSPHILLYLLRRHRRAKDWQALDMVVKTLSRMRLGGIYDQVGFGFHRYATDKTWLVPHFEKMLYDQAMCLMAYAEGYQLTGEPLFGRTAAEIAAYVTRDLADPAGGFASAEDADSEGVEGKFYVWTAAEIASVLAPDEASLIGASCGVRPEGNFREEASREQTGANILHFAQAPAALAARLKIDEGELGERMESARKKLFAARAGRIRPHKDDKVLTDWNGLMIAALAKAATALDDPGLLAPARAAAGFILERMLVDGRLLHRYRDGQAGIPGTLADHAFLLWGLSELAEASLEDRWLTAARDIAGIMLAHFEDEENGGFFLTADDAEVLPVRQKDVQDHALPSGNSVAAYAFLRLSRQTGEAAYEEAAARLLRAFSASVNQVPSAFAMLLCALDLALGESLDVVLEGDPASPEFAALAKAARATYDPRRIVSRRLPGTSLVPSLPAAGAGAPAVAHVCRDRRCEQSTVSPGELARFLG